MNQNRIRAPKQVMDLAPCRVSDLPLVFLAERLELSTAAGTDVALAARKLRLRDQRHSRDRDHGESCEGPNCNGQRCRFKSVRWYGGGASDHSFEIALPNGGRGQLNAGDMHARFGVGG